MYVCVYLYVSLYCYVSQCIVHVRMIKYNETEEVQTIIVHVL